MQLLSFSSYAERSQDPDLQICWQRSAELLPALQREPGPVFCGLCEKVSLLQLPPGVTDAREHLSCPHCGLNSRIRAGITLLRESSPAAARVYMTEQATPAFVWMQQNNPGVVGSEYQPDAGKRARLSEHLAALGGRGNVQFQDLTALTFDDGSFDAIISFDVLEHIPDYQAALEELSRVLCAGGTLVATFPFTNKAETKVRAVVKPDGGIEHLLEPEYHGDPISDGGVLCFYHFGWDVLDAAMRAGFSSARMVMPWAPESGFHFGLWTMVARR